MIAKLKAYSVAAAFLAMAACASAPFKSTWRVPDEGPFTIAGQKIAALYLSDVEATRRNAEEAMAEVINARGGRGVTAYSILDPESIQDRAAALELLRKAGIEKALVMRVAARERENLPPYPYPYPWAGSRFGSYRGPYGWGWSAIYDPAYGYPETFISIETRLYDVVKDRLMWAGVSPFRSPSDLVEFIRRLAGEAFNQIEKAGLS